MRILSGRLSGFLSGFPVRKSLLVIFLATFLVPFLLVSFLFVWRLYGSMVGWEVSRVRQSLVQTEKNFGSLLSDVKRLSDRIYVNRQLQDVVTTVYGDIRDVYYDYMEMTFLEDYMNSYPAVANFRIYTTNSTLLDNSFIIKTTPQVEAEDWYRRAMRDKGLPFWTYKTDTVTRKMYLCLVRSVWGMNSGEFIGVLVININSDVVRRNLSVQMFETAVMFGGELVFSSEEDISSEDSRTLREFLRRNSPPPPGRITRIRYRGAENGIIAERFWTPGGISVEFVIMYIIPLRQLVRMTRYCTLLAVVILAILALLSFMLIGMFSSYITGRLGKIQRGISGVVSNNFEIEPSIGGNDEFGAIYSALYDMSSSIKKLIAEVYEQNLEKERMSARHNEMRYKMLATQINPHFLFNTIETIRMKALSSGDRDVSQMLKLLASLLRYNLSVRGQPVPLISELEAVQNYLTIQHIRFGRRVTYDIATMCDVQHIYILPLLIQPLVENSFSHGLEDKSSDGFIYILISASDHDGVPELAVSVRDNGCGIQPERLAGIREKLESELTADESDSIGLANVNSRIRLFYGPEYGISISSVPDGGTEVTINIPLVGTDRNSLEVERC